MESRKYSTGTKGRLKMHADQCREFIHANATNFHLATEFIESLDPEREDRAWQVFRNPKDTLPALQAWLSGDSTPPPSCSPLAGIQTASQLAAEGKLKPTPKAP